MKYVPIIGWTFPNSQVNTNNDQGSQTGNAGLDGLFEFNYQFGRVDDFPTDISSSFSQLGIYPKDVNIVIDEETIRSGKPIYVLMPPTMNMSSNEVIQKEEIAIKGTSAPNITIGIYIYNQDTFQIYNVRTNDFGFWDYDFINDLPVGEYSVYSVGNNQYGYISLPSEIQRLNVKAKPEIITTPATTGEKIRHFVEQKQVAYSINLIENINLWVAVSLTLLSLFGLIFEIFNLILFLINQLASWLGIIPPRDPWGVVYNSETKEPVDLAIVRLYDRKTKKLIETRVTSKNGRYGFLVKKGKYIVRVTKPSFIFPAQGQFGRYDGRYSNLYFGEEIIVNHDHEIINLNIPITPKESIKHSIMREQKYHLRQIQYYLGMVSFPLLALGFVVSIVIALIHGGFLNYFVMATYFIAIIYQVYRLNIEPKPWGIIYDSKTGQPLPMAIVKIIDPDYSRILETKLTDYAGRFAFMVVPGKYIIQVEKEEYNFPSRACVLINKKQQIDWYCGEMFEIKSEKEAFINIDIPLDLKHQ